MMTYSESQLMAMIEFIKELARALIECGCSSNRLEALAHRVGDSWDIKVEVMALPTGVWISAKKSNERMIDLVRIREWSMDLDRLAKLNSLVDSIYDHRINIPEAHYSLLEISKSPPPYGTGLTLLAGAGSSSVLMYFYDGTPLEIGLAFPIGALLQFLQKYLFVGENRRYLSDFLSAAFATIYALIMYKFYPEIDVPRLIIAGIIVLTPGLVMTNAVHELDKRISSLCR